MGGVDELYAAVGNPEAEGTNGPCKGRGQIVNTGTCEVMSWLIPEITTGGRFSMVVIVGAAGVANASPSEGDVRVGAKCKPLSCMVGGGGIMKESSSLSLGCLGWTRSLVILCMTGGPGVVKELSFISTPGA